MDDVLKAVDAIESDYAGNCRAAREIADEYFSAEKVVRQSDEPRRLVKIIFSGTIGRSGLGGQGWASLQYILGLHALGHDVVYLEDCGEGNWVWDWEKNEWNYDVDYPAAYVDACLRKFGLGERWVYRTNRDARGMSLEKFRGFCAEADLLIMRAAPLWTWREEYDRPRRRAFIDVDPGFTQMTAANGDKGWIDGLARCEAKFTVGQRIGAPDCPVPTAHGPWIPTLPPVFLPDWSFAMDDNAPEFTSVMRWQGFKELTYNGIPYGQRDQEFPAFFDLPKATSQAFCIAQMGMKPELLTTHGWRVLPGEDVSRTLSSYRDFIAGSRAEISIPKSGYVKMRGGWFSDRSVCYLASGRPILMEDTGLDWLPAEDGVVRFKDFAGAVEGVRQINADYPKHRRAARALAETVFATERVLRDFSRQR